MTNKTKRTLWEEIKFASKVGVITSLLMQPVIQNVMGYIGAKYDINKEKTPEAKERIAEYYKEGYEEANILLKPISFGSYLTANKYLKNNQ